MVKRIVTAKQNQDTLEKLTEKVFVQFQATLKTKGYELVKYLDGEINKQTSDKARKVFEKANEKAEKELEKGNWMYEVDLEKELKKENISLIFMSDGEDIPDWAIKQNGQSSQYLALIEITKGVIEVNDLAVMQDMEQLAIEWEKERKIFSATPVFDEGHFGFLFSDEVSIVENC